MIGRPAHRLEVVTSTNDEAKRLLAEGAIEGTVVVAREQTAGRGRRGRIWHSAPGNLYLSVVLRPAIPPAAAPPLAPAIGLAVALAIEEVAPVTAELKWPNDVFVGGRKVAGVLVESVVQAGIAPEGGRLAGVVVGIGINVGAEVPPELAETATTLAREAGRGVRREELEAALFGALEEVYRRFVNEGFRSLSAEWAERDRLAGRKVTVQRASEERVTGVARGIAASGALRLETTAGVLEIAAGEVT